jgi:hypothetical protein
MLRRRLLRAVHGGVLRAVGAERSLKIKTTSEAYILIKEQSEADMNQNQDEQPRIPGA